MKIYLGSKSPRRQELLKLMEVPFELLIIDAPEIVNPDESPLNYSVRITKEKMLAAWDKVVSDKLEKLPILCADTECILNDKILGKPADEFDAFNMLKSISGKTHQVLTTVGLIYNNYQETITNTTAVSFANIPDNEVLHYINSGNYKDKSGGYGIQSYIGQFITGINGCFYSVMGLPLNSVKQLFTNYLSRKK